MIPIINNNNINHNTYLTLYDNDNNRRMTIFTTVDELISHGYVTEKRPNPKRRKKIKQMNQKRI